uniref:Uncharacterized protein n=1 Tax=Ixodes ricinus TaxID=34613 RepID=A0A6B0UJT3_IXORI
MVATLAPSTLAVLSSSPLGVLVQPTCRRAFPLSTRPDVLAAVRGSSTAGTSWTRAFTGSRHSVGTFRRIGGTPVLLFSVSVGTVLGRQRASFSHLAVPVGMDLSTLPGSAL